MTRKALIETGADFEQVAKLTHITTAKGRHLQRQKFKVQLKRAHNEICKKSGKKLTRAITKKLYMDDIAKKYAERITEEKERIKRESRQQREATYRINTANASAK